MAKLDAKERKALPKKDFVEPAKRGYPIENESHARNALARSSGKPVHKEVEEKVHRKYPDIRVDGGGFVHKVKHKNAD